jgi:transcriptional regulator
MYVPKEYAWNDQDEIKDYIDNHPFGTIISTGAEKHLLASHLPFIRKKNTDALILFSHLAKANEQHSNWEGQEVLLIFSGTQSYISPTAYEATNKVPTWNYMAIHLYGKIEMIQDEELNRQLLATTVKHFEPEFYPHYQRVEESFKAPLVQGILGFKFTAQRIVAQEKMSQDKHSKDRMSIISQLEKSGDQEKMNVANQIKKKL